MAVRRFIPDFKYQEGNAKVTLFVSSYPDDVAVSSPLGPFTVTKTTDKVDTRARGRLVSVKIENALYTDLDAARLALLTSINAINNIGGSSSGAEKVVYVSDMVHLPTAIGGDINLLPTYTYIFTLKSNLITHEYMTCQPCMSFTLITLTSIVPLCLVRSSFPGYDLNKTSS